MTLSKFKVLSEYVVLPFSVVSIPLRQVFLINDLKNTSSKSVTSKKLSLVKSKPYVASGRFPGSEVRINVHSSPPPTAHPLGTVQTTNIASPG